MVSQVEIYRLAMKIIQQCGERTNPKVYAFAESSCFYEKGDIENATVWAHVANAIDILLEDTLISSTLN